MSYNRFIIHHSLFDTTLDYDLAVHGIVTADSDKNALKIYPEFYSDFNIEVEKSDDQMSQKKTIWRL